MKLLMLTKCSSRSSNITGAAIRTQPMTPSMYKLGANDSKEEEIHTYRGHRQINWMIKYWVAASDDYNIPSAIGELHVIDRQLEKPTITKDCWT